ncbi:MAG: magnesium-translocating P-type ATPase, partial [Psittacicella sp.]
MLNRIKKKYKKQSFIEENQKTLSKESFNNIETTFANYSASSEGLSKEEVLHRRQIYGDNKVDYDKPPVAIMQLLLAFNNPFIYVLIVLAIVSFITDYLVPYLHHESTSLTTVIIITTMIIISVVLKFTQEYRTNKAAAALKTMVHTTATVFRKEYKEDQPEIVEIPLERLVPGDVIRLGAGDMVPADCKLIKAKDLFVNQGVLTGESIPVEKSCDPQHKTNINTSVIDLSNICLMGTNIESGSATAIIVATGSKTYFGSLAKSIIGTNTKTAFDKGVNSVSWLLIKFMLVMVPVVFFINGFTKGSWLNALLFALAVAVGLTPEMLPMIVSSNLAKGAIMMAKRKVVVKHLNSIQNFGAMDVLCTDKTGTLTQDRIILEHHLDTKGANNNDILSLAWLNSYHQSGVKNLIDKAIIHFSEDNDTINQVRQYLKIDELPFDFVRRRLSIVVQNDDLEHIIICKGAVEEIMDISTHMLDNGKIVPITNERSKELLEVANSYNKQGFRVLALATKNLGVKGCTRPLAKDDEHSLIINGFLTFLDPPKDSAIEAIEALREHGVAVKVLTGDNPVITTKICHEVGLTPGIPLLGTEIEELSDKELSALVEQRTVFAKLTPLQKSRVLKTLQKNGHTVGFLGDGINDAPALKDADVGISVDTGTDIAKESADIILLEKNLMVLEEGIIKGRETFGNIMKYLNMTASSNFGNVFSILIASIFLPFLPMLAIQILILSLMYDISQLTLPWDKMDKDFLRIPRKWDAKNIGKFMIWFGPTSSIFDVVTFTVMWFVFKANSPAHQSLFHSGWFIESLLSQTLVIHMLRTRRIPFIQSTASLPVILGTIIVVTLGVLIPFTLVGKMIGLPPLPPEYFIWLG